jgi:ABC-type transport system involved in cytochrome bd biosynthesis fused ATPase/permease subunit
MKNFNFIAAMIAVILINAISIYPAIFIGAILLTLMIILPSNENSNTAREAD